MPRREAATAARPRRRPPGPGVTLARNPPAAPVRSRLLQPGQLFVGDRGVELGEQRPWLLKRRSGPDRRALPSGGCLVVTGDDRIHRPAILVHLVDPRPARP